MGTVVDDADEEEHASGRDSVGQHHVHGPIDAIGIVTRIDGRSVGREDRHDRHAQSHVSHVADGTVGDQLLEVGLGHRHQGPVEDAEDTENGDPH